MTINPYNPNQPINNQSSGNNASEPQSVTNDMIGLWLLFLTGDVGADSGSSGNWTTGLMIAQYVNDLMKNLSSSGSPADQQLLQDLNSGSPSIADLAASIMANNSEGHIDITDIQKLMTALNSTAAGNNLQTLITSPYANSWFAQVAAAGGASYSWSGSDQAAIQSLLTSFLSSNGGLITDMLNTSLPLATRLHDAQLYAQSFMSLYTELNTNPSNPFVQALDQLVNTLAPAEYNKKNETFLQLLQPFLSGSTPTQQDLTDLLNILAPGGETNAPNGFQRLLNDFLSAMTSGYDGNGIFSGNGPFSN